MPLNVLRLNERRLHPTPNIVFIKALEGRTDRDVAEEMLYRVAAICHPIVKQHHLSVTTLEEFPPNREFVGRNFNNGECIQLVLRTRRGGGGGSGADGGNESNSSGGEFISFRAVVMVMMHELAHNVHMNHSRAFWATRNQYADEMRQLWARNYTGEGMWGPGRQAATGITVAGGRELGGADMPEHLCGGTFRSRRRGAAGKRKRAGDGKPKVDWREQKARRIARKFGPNGQALGEDSLERMSLQGFKGPTTKSRVAGSKRGRELRAAAALARFETDKKYKAESERNAQDEDGGGETDGETDDGDDSEECEDPDEGLQDAVDIDGSQMKDAGGRGLVRVCEDQDRDDDCLKQELDELHDLDSIPFYEATNKQVDTGKGKRQAEKMRVEPADSAPTWSIFEKKRKSETDTTYTAPRKPQDSKAAKRSEKGAQEPVDLLVRKEVACQVCTLVNDAAAFMCVVCSNVLEPDKSPGAWRCQSEGCRGSNPLERDACGVCGARR